MKPLFLPFSGVQVGGDFFTSFHPFFWPKEMLKPVTRGDKRDASCRQSRMCPPYLVPRVSILPFPVREEERS